MRLALAFMFQNERHWLELHLPEILKEADIDGIVALDGGSHDGSASAVEFLVNGRYPLQIGVRQFDWRFDLQSNALIGLCQTLGYQAMCRLDPDELIFPAGIATIRRQLEQVPTVCLPRVNFEGDRLHWRPADYPDYQLRAFRLDQGYRYVSPVHEVLAGTDGYAVDGLRSMVNLFHYEAIRPNDVRRFSKHNNYRLLAEGKPPIELPDDFPVPDGAYRKPCVPFDGEQPLDPLIVGVRAPFEEVTP